MLISKAKLTSGNANNKKLVAKKFFKTKKNKKNTKWIPNPCYIHWYHYYWDCKSLARSDVC